MYIVYILLCADDSYYTGLTNDFEKRIWQHDTDFFLNAIHLSEDQVKLVWYRRIETEADANNLEKQIKGWSRKKKGALISGNIGELKRLSNAKRNFKGPSPSSGPG